MEFKDGSKIYSVDKQEAGSLRRVVIDPKTNIVTHIVIQKGFLFTEDRVVPVEKVASASKDEVDLNCTLVELKEMSPLDINQPTAKGGEQDISQTAGGMYATPSTDAFVTNETTRTIPENLVALKEGARVVSADGKHIGHIDRVFTQDGKVNGFSLSQGLLIKTHKSIPIEWVKDIGDKEVNLSVDGFQVDDLPTVQNS
jgi:uncharacterized protein YrrD